MEVRVILGRGNANIFLLIFISITTLMLTTHFRSKLMKEQSLKRTFQSNLYLRNETRHHIRDEDNSQLVASSSTTTTITTTSTSTLVESSDVISENRKNLSEHLMGKKEELRSLSADRLGSIRRFCAKKSNRHVLKRHQQIKLPGPFFMSDEFNLAYCTLPKTGTNTWLTHLANMGTNASLKHAYFAQGRKNFQNMLNYNYLRGAKKVDFGEKIVFTFTRHPFTRLVSGYQHALVGTTLQTMFKVMNKEIIEFAGPNRKNLTGLFSKVARPAEFVRYLVHKVKKDGWASINAHFTPQWIRCPFCLDIFDFIGRKDTFKSDAATLNTTLELNIKPSLATGHINNAKWKVNNFFSVLKEQEIRDLYEIFREDFQLLGFNENLDEFIKIRTHRGRGPHK